MEIDDVKMEPLTVDNLNDSGIERLMSRIAVQAVHDYKEAWERKRRDFLRMKKLEKSKEFKRGDSDVMKDIDGCKSRIKYNEHTIESIERFFKSDWGMECSGYDGEIIVDKLRKDMRTLMIYGDKDSPYKNI